MAHLKASKDCHKHSESGGNNWYQIGRWGAVLIIGYFLLSEHQAHVIAVLPYLFLLACPLMHIFMHRGHGHHEHNHEHKIEGKN